MKQKQYVKYREEVLSGHRLVEYYWQRSLPNNAVCIFTSSNEYDLYSARVGYFRYLDVYTIGFIKKGGVNLKVKGKNLKLDENDIFIGKPNCIYQGNAASLDKEICFVSFPEISFSILGKKMSVEIRDNLFLKKDVVRMSDPEICSEIKCCISKMRKENTENFSYDGRLMKSLLLAELLVLLYRQHQKNTETVFNENRKVFDGFLDYVNKGYKSKCSMKECAKEMNISISKLYKCVKSVCGISPKQMYDICRCMEAIRRLLHTEDTIKYIVVDMGFNGSDEFCRFIGRLSGKTPSQIRKDGVEPKGRVKERIFF